MPSIPLYSKSAFCRLKTYVGSLKTLDSNKQACSLLVPGNHSFMALGRYDPNRAIIPAAGAGGAFAVAAADYARRAAIRAASRAANNAFNYASSTARDYWKQHPKMNRRAYNNSNSTSFRARPRSYAMKNTRTGGLVGVETKFIDCWGEDVNPVPSSLPSLIPATVLGSTVNHVTPVGQGTGESERIGRNIWVRSLQLTFFAEVQQAAVAAALAMPNECEVTFFVVLDKQCNSTNPSAAAIWTQPVASVALGGHPLRNLEYKDRFSILATRRLVLSPNSESDGAIMVLKGDHEYGKFFKKWKGKGWKQQYDATGAAISSVTNEAISVWVHVTNPPYTNPAPGSTVYSVGFQGRARYTS